MLLNLEEPVGWMLDVFENVQQLVFEDGKGYPLLNVFHVYFVYVDMESYFLKDKTFLPTVLIRNTQPTVAIPCWFPTSVLETIHHGKVDLAITMDF